MFHGWRIPRESSIADGKRGKEGLTAVKIPSVRKGALRWNLRESHCLRAGALEDIWSGSIASSQIEFQITVYRI